MLRDQAREVSSQSWEQWGQYHIKGSVRRVQVNQTHF